MGSTTCMPAGTTGALLFLDDVDREGYLVAARGAWSGCQRWRCLSYCLMDNHLHLLSRRRSRTSGSGMRRLHGDFARGLNRRHALQRPRVPGPVRVRSLSGTRGTCGPLPAYIAANPVAAGLCNSAPERGAGAATRVRRPRRGRRARALVAGSRAAVRAASRRRAATRGAVLRGRRLRERRLALDRGGAAPARRRRGAAPGAATSTSAPAARSSSAVPKPQVTPTARRPWAWAASMSTWRSPTIVAGAPSRRARRGPWRPWRSWTRRGGRARARRRPRTRRRSRARRSAAPRTRAAWRSRPRAGGPARRRRSRRAPRARPGRSACRAARPPRRPTR